MGLEKPKSGISRQSLRALASLERSRRNRAVRVRLLIVCCVLVAEGRSRHKRQERKINQRRTFSDTQQDGSAPVRGEFTLAKLAAALGEAGEKWEATSV